jgi:adenosine kinase
MSQRILISGSIAYDNIMVFDGHFKDHILADKVHMLNVSFLTPQLKREFGGTAANIALNLKMLGGDPFILAAIGQDGKDYLARLKEFGINLDGIALHEDLYTAQAFITTDLAANQITAFHPGAMMRAHLARAKQGGAACFGTVSPNGKDAMLGHAKEFQSLGIPFLFDPGQGLPMFSGGELRDLIESADALTVNDYESKMIADKTGWTEEELADHAGVMVVTRGGEGSTVFAAGTATLIKPAPIGKAIDPTGCGDAYRGGLLYGLAAGWNWVKAAQLGSIMGATKIEHQGPQNHWTSRANIAKRFADVYGETL